MGGILIWYFYFYLNTKSTNIILDGTSFNIHIIPNKKIITGALLVIENNNNETTTTGQMILDFTNKDRYFIFPYCDKNGCIEVCLKTKINDNKTYDSTKKYMKI